MKLAYQHEIRKNRVSGSNEVLDTLPYKKQGRPVLLGEKFDGMVQPYIRRVCEAVGSISSQVVIAAARGILTSMDIWRPCGIEQVLGTFFTHSNEFCPEEGDNSKSQIF